MVKIEDMLKDTKEFGEILRNEKDKGGNYKEFVAGVLAGARLAMVSCRVEIEKKAG